MPVPGLNGLFSRKSIDFAIFENHSGFFSKPQKKNLAGTKLVQWNPECGDLGSMYPET